MASVKTYESIDVDKFNYNKPTKYNNSYFGPLSYDTNTEPIYVQTPKLRCKTNIKDVLDNKNPYLEVSIPKNRLDFYDLFLNIDDKNVKTTFDKSEEWFGKALPREAIEEMYKPITKGFKKNTEPTIKFKIPVSKGKLQCSCYNQMKNFIDVSEIKENDEIILNLNLKGLKVLKQHYFCDCYISQIKLFQEKDLKYNIIEDYSFIDVEEEEEEDYSDILDQELIHEFNKEKEEKEKKIQEIKQKMEENKKLLEDLENN